MNDFYDNGKQSHDSSDSGQQYPSVQPKAYYDYGSQQSQSSQSNNYYDYYQQPGYNDGGKRPRKNRKGVAVFAGILASVFIVSVVGFSAFAVIDLYSKGLIGSSASSQDAQDASSSSIDLSLTSKPVTSVSSNPDGQYTTQEVAEIVTPSVVGVVTYAQSQSLQLQELAEGSGIVMTADGYIITNAHVVSGASAVKVILSNGDEYEADIIGSDSKTDLAVLKVDTTGLTPATFGDSTQVAIGEDVVAIGNAAGLSGSLTKGVVSGLNRKVSTEEGDSIYALNCIQVDAAINPGNSGGPLLNMFGQVIGINSSKYVGTDYEGIGFAISINDAKPVIDQLINYGYIPDRVRIGISYEVLTDVIAQQYNLPAGLVVRSIDPNCDVANSGLEVYDIITEINGQSVASGDTITQILKDLKPGDTITLTAFRQSVVGQGRTMQFQAKLEEDKGTTTNNIEQQQPEQQFPQGVQ